MERRVETDRLDVLTKRVATATTRRRAIVGLGAFALGGAGVLGLSSTVAPVSAKTDRCLTRCFETFIVLTMNRKAYRRCKRQCNTI
jgi:hypothetical protein